ncbi:hypothetical protein [Mycobacterium leprae]|uniref:hypothetical protein n=1 Tax=Mycobacterium leprae TaxID=1769 RepID=UPI000AEDD2C9|nr:hypothetical protein [Mycobacterium leprae]
MRGEQFDAVTNQLPDVEVDYATLDAAAADIDAEPAVPRCRTGGVARRRGSGRICGRVGARYSNLLGETWLFAYFSLAMMRADCLASAGDCDAIGQ